MRIGASFILAAALLTTARASIITITITGTTSGVQVGEGPVFGYGSYRKIPDGTAFTLIYTFDDTKGKGGVFETDGGIITQSEIEAAGSSSPGTNATLQIGRAVWEFGASTDSQVKLSTAANKKDEQIVFSNPASGNRVSSYICPAERAYWPRNGDWRANFTASALSGSTGSFSANNGSVSAKGRLAPSSITVTGLNLDGQWLSYTTTAGGPADQNWEREWHLAQASPKGGYVVQHVSRTIIGTKPDGSPIMPSSIEYWEAWPVPPGSQVTVPAIDRFDRFMNAAPADSSGSDTVSASARFYEGLILPPVFAAGNNPYAASPLSSNSDPNLPTSSATLPVALNATLHF